MDAADYIDQSGKALTGTLGSLSWAGNVALAFEDLWSNQHKPRMVMTSAFLRDNADRLRQQAADQRRASDPDAQRGNRQLDDPAPRHADRRVVKEKFGLPGAVFHWDSYRESLLKLQDFSSIDLFAGPPGAEISPEDVVQGQLGDCYFVAALAALAATPAGRAQIRQMIHDNGDGTFTVTFANGQKVTVDDDFWVGADGVRYAKVGDDLWAAILEKAYAQRAGDYENIVGGTGEAVFDAFGMTGEHRNIGRGDAEFLERLISDGGPVTLSARLDNPDGIYGYPEGDRHEPRSWATTGRPAFWSPRSGIHGAPTTG